MSLYSGDMGSLNPNAPPSFRQGDFTFNQANGFIDPSGNQIGSANPYWSSAFGGMDSNNFRFYGGGGTDPNSFSLQYKNGPTSGMVYDYTLQNGQWTPGAGRQEHMGGNTKYGPDTWIPALGMGSMWLAGLGAGAGLGTGATTGAEAMGTGAAPGEAAGSFTGSYGGGGGGSGLFGSGIKGGDAVKLGSLAYGLLGGGKGGSGSGGGVAPSYSGAPMRSLSEVMGQAPQPRVPMAQNINPQGMSAADVWNAYAGGLLGGGRPQPQPAPGVLDVKPGRPVQRTGGY